MINLYHITVRLWCEEFYIGAAHVRLQGWRGPPETLKTASISSITIIWDRLSPVRILREPKRKSTSKATRVVSWIKFGLTVTQGDSFPSQNSGGKAKRITKTPFNSFLIGKHDQLPECTPATLTIHPLLCEAGLTPASIVLDNRQRMYAYRLLSLPDKHPTKNILPVSLRIGDGNLDELPEDNLMWTQNTRPSSYGQWLAWQLTIDHSIDPADGAEPVKIIKPDTKFVGEIIIDSKIQALREARKSRTGLTMI